jgi:hypothetical protein
LSRRSASIRPTRASIWTVTAIVTPSEALQGSTEGSMPTPHMRYIELVLTLTRTVRRDLPNGGAHVLGLLKIPQRRANAPALAA